MNESIIQSSKQASRLSKQTRSGNPGQRGKHSIAEAFLEAILSGALSVKKREGRSVTRQERAGGDEERLKTSSALMSARPQEEKVGGGASVGRVGGGVSSPGPPGLGAESH